MPCCKKYLNRGFACMRLASNLILKNPFKNPLHKNLQKRLAYEHKTHLDFKIILYLKNS
jgi:hypothetical protein